MVLGQLDMKDSEGGNVPQVDQLVNGGDGLSGALGQVLQVLGQGLHHRISQALKECLSTLEGTVFLEGLLDRLDHFRSSTAGVLMDLRFEKVLGFPR
jgi:hypothetical protein